MNDKTRLMSPLAVISFPSRSWCWWTFETQQRRTTLINKMQECCNIGPIHLLLLDVKLRCKGVLRFTWSQSPEVAALDFNTELSLISSSHPWYYWCQAKPDELAHYELSSSTVLLLLLLLLLWLVNTCTIYWWSVNFENIKVWML